jgi:hypothetical protein
MQLERAKIPIAIGSIGPKKQGSLGGKDQVLIGRYFCTDIQ